MLTVSVKDTTGRHPILWAVDIKLQFILEAISRGVETDARRFGGDNGVAVGERIALDGYYGGILWRRIEGPDKHAQTVGVTRVGVSGHIEVRRELLLRIDLGVRDGNGLLVLLVLLLVLLVLSLVLMLLVRMLMLLLMRPVILLQLMMLLLPRRLLLLLGEVRGYDVGSRRREGRHVFVGGG